MSTSTRGLVFDQYGLGKLQIPIERNAFSEDEIV